MSRSCTAITNPGLRIDKLSASQAFEGDAELVRLAAKALQIRMAAQFDPMLAVNTSDLEPLPHQIRAVYGELLPRTPLRFLLADDPGAGKTIMAGLYIKELLLRGDMERCLMRRPGSSSSAPSMRTLAATTSPRRSGSPAPVSKPEALVSAPTADSKRLEELDLAACDFPAWQDINHRVTELNLPHSRPTWRQADWPTLNKLSRCGLPAHTAGPSFPCSQKRPVRSSGTWSRPRQPRSG